jgi:hypothetical protein
MVAARIVRILPRLFRKVTKELKWRKFFYVTDVSERNAR